MSVMSGQAVVALFATANPTTGAAADASSTPTGTLYVNGVANAAVVTVTNITTGLYKAAFTLPALTVGAVVALRVAATVAGVAGEAVVWQEVYTDVLTEVVPGSYASGTAGSALGHIAGAEVSIVSPVAENLDVELVYGDDYLAADGRALVFTLPDSDPSVLGGSATLKVNNGAVLTFTGTILAARSVSVDLDTDDTASLGVGRWRYELECETAGGSIFTPVRAVVTVVADLR